MHLSQGGVREQIFISPVLCLATGIEALVDELMHTEQLNKKVCRIRVSRLNPGST